MRWQSPPSRCPKQKNWTHVWLPYFSDILHPIHQKTMVSLSKYIQNLTSTEFLGDDYSAATPVQVCPTCHLNLCHWALLPWNLFSTQQLEWFFSHDYRVITLLKILPYTVRNSINKSTCTDIHKWRYDCIFGQSIQKAKILWKGMGNTLTEFWRTPVSFSEKSSIDSVNESKVEWALFRSMDDEARRHTKHSRFLSLYYVSRAF